MQAIQALQVRLEAELKEFRSLQKRELRDAKMKLLPFAEIGNYQNSRAQYLTQVNENDMVKKELELVEADGEIFKLIGPALIKQEKTEALSNVNKRLEFIKGELKKVDTTIGDLEKKSEDKKNK
ncbi:prefoldin subunit 6-like isoform 1, partial [Planoprotostelium fungivorum]